MTRIIPRWLLVPIFRTYRGATTASSAAVLDAGLRAYMLRVFNWMASGLLLTGIVAYGIAHTDAINYLYPTVQSAQGFLVRRPSGLAYLLMFAPLAFVLVLSFGVNKLSRTAAQTLFWVFAAVMGASLTNIFLIYTQTSIVSVFFICAATFAATSAWGYVTKRDLTAMGSFMMMGLFGIIIAAVVNMFRAFERAAAGHQHHRRARLHRAHGLRHAADQDGTISSMVMDITARCRPSAASMTR